MTVRLRVIAFGQVQGVGYRAFARRHARALGVTGYVRNLDDGSVEVVAEGTRALLSRLLPVVRRGSPSGHVERVIETWEAATGEFTAFSIR